MRNYNIFFTSDTHFSHANAINFLNYDGSRMRPFDTWQEADEKMIENWNKVVKPTDKVYFLGDLAFNKNEADKIMPRLNGKKCLIKGNHDLFKPQWYLLWFYDIRACHNFENFLMTHVPVHPDSKARFKMNIHGHCVDDKTEILTTNGFKKFNDFKGVEKVINLNTTTGFAEVDDIKTLVSKNYSGNVYTFKATGFNARVTSKHRMLYLTKSGYHFQTAENLKIGTHMKLIRGVTFQSEGLNLSDDMIRLLIWIAADGSKANENLIRFRLYKKRKIENLTALLSKLKIPFKVIEYKKERGFSINFYVPKELKDYSFKPLDRRILMCNRHQAEIIREEYAKTDGRWTAKNSVTIYTSKPEEVEVLQQMFILNGYSATVATRVNHGFAKKDGSDKISYDLTINGSATLIPNTNREFATIEHVENEHFWCVETNNGTIITRREGSVCVLGNCHCNKIFLPNKQGQLTKIEDPWYRNVCMDSNNYTPVAYEDIQHEYSVLVQKGLLKTPKERNRSGN